MSGSVELETGCVSPGGGIDESPAAVPPSVPVPPPCSVSGRDSKKSPRLPFYTARVGQMKAYGSFNSECGANDCRMLAASLQVHAAEEVLKACVGARRVEDGVHLQTSQPGLAHLARL